LFRSPSSRRQSRYRWSWRPVSVLRFLISCSSHQRTKCPSRYSWLF